MQSPLSFDSTENFRKKLLVKNLQPYNSDGFRPASQPGQSEIIINDAAVIDTQEVEVIGQSEGTYAYIKNQYGPEGGFGLPKSIEDVTFINSVTSFSNTINLDMGQGIPALVGKSPYNTFIAYECSKDVIYNGIKKILSNTLLFKTSFSKIFFIFHDYFKLK